MGKVGEGLVEKMMSSGLKSPGDDAADDTSEVLDMLDIDLPGIPGRRPATEDRYDGGLKERLKLAIALVSLLLQPRKDTVK